MSVDSLPLEWDHTGDVGGSSSHEDDEEEDGQEEEGAYFSALSGRVSKLTAKVHTHSHFLVINSSRVSKSYNIDSECSNGLVGGEIGTKCSEAVFIKKDHHT